MPGPFTPERVKAILRRAVKSKNAGALEKILADDTAVEQFTIRLNLIAADIRSSSAALRRELEYIGTATRTLADVLPAHMERYQENDHRLPYLRALCKAARDVRDRRLPFAISPVEHWEWIGLELQSQFSDMCRGAGKLAAYRFIAEVITGETVKASSIGASFTHEQKRPGSRFRPRPKPAIL